MPDDFWEEVSFVQRSPNRRKVLSLLVEAGRPMTPAELAEEMGVVLKSASRAVRQLDGHGLVECMNPDAPRDRRYRPTGDGREVREEVERVEATAADAGEPVAFAEPPLEYETGTPEELEEAVEFVQISSNRKAVMRQLASSDVPLTPTELSEGLDMAFNSASRALRQLADHGLARCVTPESERYRRYELTATGEDVYDILSEG